MRMVHHDLETGITYLSTSDATLLRMACNRLSLQAGKEGISEQANVTAPELKAVRSLVDICNNKVSLHGFHTGQ